MKNKFLQILFMLIFSTQFVGCGGSGSGGGGSTPGPTTPIAPTGVIATPGNSQATITWTSVSGATSYNIYWSTTSGVTTTNGTKITGATKPYALTGLTNGVTYYCVVTAANTGGESAASSQVSTTPSIASPPAVPTGVIATGGDGQVIIAWTAVTGATSYNIYWSTIPGVTTVNGTKISSATNPSTQSGLTNGITYYYVITAVNSNGESTASSQVSAITAAGGATVMPLTVTTKSLSPATAGAAYTKALGVVGSGPFQWDGSTIAPGGAKNGLTIGNTTGILSGPPTYAGTQPIFLTVQGATNSVGIEYDLTIGGIGSTQSILGTPPSGTQSIPYNHKFLDTWDTDPLLPCGNMTWVFGSIPPGMSFNSLTHVLKGTPTFAGAYTFTIFTNPASSACGPAPTNLRTVTVSFAPAASPTTPPGSSNWTRRGSEAVLSPSASGWDSFMISAPSVIKVGSAFYLYYEGQSDTTFRRSIGLAISIDGITWTKSTSNPVLSAGTSGTWDSGGVRYPVVYFDGIKYWMWYQGNGTGGNAIGLATSVDGVNWTKNATNPVILTSGLFSSYAPSALVKSGTQLILYYSVDGSIGRMTSVDGIHWNDTGFVFNPPSSTDIRFSRAAVIFDGTTYRMWHTEIEALGGGAGNPNAVYTITIGYADSPDGITWTTYGNPIFTAGSDGAWDRPGVGTPAVAKDAAKYHMWYVGGRGNLPGTLYDANAFVEGAIGYAVIP